MKIEIRSIWSLSKRHIIKMDYAKETRFEFTMGYGPVTLNKGDIWVVNKIDDDMIYVRKGGVELKFCINDFVDIFKEVR